MKRLFQNPLHALHPLSNSPCDYLNYAIFLGTLTMPQLKPDEKPYVIIGAYRVL
jgi:hypothetical protein